ncbi:hypothetical protein FQN50_005700 [Emmonsiellopsis sp. PD_5]|nr:hypothetical protein FQN50_005700 [Emmonsiellopsis sp. PD_5]
MQASLKTELEEYLKPNISSCQSIRPLFDVITTIKDEPMSVDGSKGIRNPPPYLAFEWMEGDLWDIGKTHKKDIILFEAVVTSILKALVTLGLNNRVHADLKAGNILFNCPKPATFNGDTKPLGACGSRAPEVHEGKGYHHTADVWALGMTLLKVFNEDAFVYELPPGSHYADAEVIAQLMRIYPGWIPNPTEGEITSIGIPLQEMFAKAVDLKPHLPIPPLEEQLEGMCAAWEVKDMLGLLLSLDQEKRSSAAMILESKEYIALSKASTLMS